MPSLTPGLTLVALNIKPKTSDIILSTSLAHPAILLVGREMRFCSPGFNALTSYRACHNSLLSRSPCRFRELLTLAIETSCDDTAVAILEKTQLRNGNVGATLYFHKKVTSNNTAYHGVHPLASLCSHQENLANLAEEAIKHLPLNRIPDFVSVTRGPGMRNNLCTGLDTAKGLAVAWQVFLLRRLR